MNTTIASDATLGQERPDQPLDEAFRLATGGAIASPNVLQHALFPRLLTQDTGLLVPTGPGAGRLEAIFVPLMVSREDSSRYGLPRQRLFIIAVDGDPLDDYYFRLGRYLKALAADAGEARTLFIASGSEPSVCERYLPGGEMIEGVCDHPLDPGVDLAVAPFSHFRSLFFGAGGIHVLPQSLLPQSAEAQSDMRPRDLFYFDDSLGYKADEILSFIRLAEFLFTQDMDMVVGSSTLPRELQEDLAFLEPLIVPEAQAEPRRSIETLPAGDGDEEAAMLETARRAISGADRVIVCAEDSAQAERLYQHLAGDAHQSVYKAIYRYDTGIPRQQRTAAYERLRERDGSGAGYVAVADGPAIEAADLSADVLVTGVCSPESLIRRAGRVNRRRRASGGELLVVGDRYPHAARELPAGTREAYRDALRESASPRPFQSRDWKPFIA